MCQHPKGPTAESRMTAPPPPPILIPAREKMGSDSAGIWGMKYLVSMLLPRPVQRLCLPGLQDQLPKAKPPQTGLRPISLGSSAVNKHTLTYLERASHRK